MGFAMGHLSGTPSSVIITDAPSHGRSQGWSSWMWPDSALFDAALSTLIGIVYGRLILGPALNPTNLAWLKGDPAQYYIGWALFAQTPGWHWPLTFTDRIGYPIGDAIANVDPNPLAALLLRPFAFLLPAKFQYLGPWAALSIALQFYFGVRLLRIFFGRRLWPSLCGGLLLTISPPLAYRLAAHFALANHWLILAAFCLYFTWQRGAIKSGPKLAIAWCSLIVIAVATTGYLALCVFGVLGAACVRSLLVRPRQWRRMSLVAGIAACLFLLSGYAIGVIRGGGGLAAAGYRMYSMNLLAPIDNRSFGLLIKAQARFSGQSEGYNYVGLGILALILILVGGIAANPRFPRWPFSEWAPLALLGFVFTALALSTKVTAGSHVVFDLDPHERLNPYLGVFRNSGRLFWVPYYLITAGAMIALFRIFQKRPAAILAIAALLIQFVDEGPLRYAIRTEVQSPRPNILRSPIWQHLGEKHANLLVFPPWQCGAEASPGGKDGFATFGMLAAAQHMRTNSYYAARYSPRSIAWHCGEGTKELLQHLREDSAYIITPDLASFVALNNPQPNLCHQVDGFILCSKVTDLGFGPGANAN